MENELLQQRLERRERRRVRGETETSRPKNSVRGSSEVPVKESNLRKRPCLSSSPPLIMNKRLKREESCYPENSIPFCSLEKNSKVADFPRFDDLTDEIFEESDDRFRLGEDVNPVEPTPTRESVRLSLVSEPGELNPEISETNERKKKNLRKSSFVSQPANGEFTR